MITKKKSSYFFALFLLMCSFSALAQERIIPESELPPAIRQYINTYFKDNKIIQCEEDREITSTTYEVKLADFKLDFNSNNNIKEITSVLHTALPDAVIPSSILSYVRTNYAGKGIVEWELKRRKQEIKLSNGLEMEFSLDGKFLRIDD